MKTLPAYMLVTLVNENALFKVEKLVAHCNLFNLLGKIVDEASEGRDWSITIKPSTIEYFMGEYGDE